MPAKRKLTMRQLRHMLRLHGDEASAGAMCRRPGVVRSSVQENLKRAEAAGLSWLVLADPTDPAIEELLFARSGVR